jgi:hypothetical protein
MSRPHESAWVELSGTVEFASGADTIHASIHPGGDSVTVGYRGGEDLLVIDAVHIDAFIELLERVKAAL